MAKFKFNEKALSPAVSHQILSNVFHLSDIEPNSVPLESITDYSNYRRQRFIFQTSTIYLVLVLFLMLPVMFITGTIIWTLNQDNTTYIVTADSIIPSDHIDVSIDGHSVTATLQDDGSYLLSPNRNGEMKVTITLSNQQELSASIAVTNVDESVPVLEVISYGTDCFYLTVSDAGSGINYDKITATYENGTAFEDWSVDRETGVITVGFPEDIVYILIPDLSNNVLRLELKP